MSGIYGIISNKKSELDYYKGLVVWNDNYGDVTEESFRDDTAFMGIKPELLKEAGDKNQGIIRTDKYIGVVDCLVYSETNAEVSDAEYIFAKVTKEGFNSLANINGDFAGAVYNEETRKLTLFRDHMGVRPLFYYADDNGVTFSTDIRGLLSLPYVDSSINEKWLYKSFGGFSAQSAEDTEYAKIKCVPFGGYVSFSFDGKTLISEKNHYWVPGRKKIRLKNRAEYEAQLRLIIEDAIKIRATATGLGVGAELSGGLDSGVIDLILSKIRKDCKYYSWSPGEEVLPLAENDERLVIKDICEKAGITCNFGGIRVNLGEDTFLGKRFPVDNKEYRWFPFAIKYAFPMYVNTTNIFETASFMKDNGVKFVFTGHGGDEGVSHRANPYELFYNHEYLRYLALMFARSDVRRRRIWGTIRLIYRNLSYAKKELRKPYSSDRFSSIIFNKEFVAKLSKEQMAPLCFSYDPQKYVIGGGSRNRLDVLAFYSACVGVRYLVPFLDYRVMDFALGIPRYLFIDRYRNRAIYRDAFKDIMPESLFNQKLKEDTSYNNLPVKKESEQEYDRTKEDVIEQKKAYLGYLDKTIWEKYLDYSLLEDWVYAKTPIQEDGMIFNYIMKCIQIEHVIKIARKAVE